jgi:tetratricopeptide (TPR) repeat protein
MRLAGETSQTIERLFRKGEWRQARLQISRGLRKSSDDHWLLTRLAMTYYEERRYSKALEITEKALGLAPSCPLVLWDYACSLDMTGNQEKAIAVWKGLLRRGLAGIAYGDHGEGIRWARSLLNDCRYRIALSYRKQGNLDAARRYLRRHIAERSRRTPSIYSSAEVKREAGRLFRK